MAEIPIVGPAPRPRINRVGGKVAALHLLKYCFRRTVQRDAKVVDEPQHSIGAQLAIKRQFGKRGSPLH